MKTKYIVNNQSLSLTGNTVIVNNWSTPSDTEWKIVTYNGNSAIELSANTNVYWFAFSGVPFSNNVSNCYDNTLRGGVIEYCAYAVDGVANGSEIGNIVFSRNCTMSSNTRTVNQFGGTLPIISGNSNGFYAYSPTLVSPNLITLYIQWTARLHYTEENQS